MVFALACESVSSRLEVVYFVSFLLGSSGHDFLFSFPFLLLLLVLVLVLLLCVARDTLSGKYHINIASHS